MESVPECTGRNPLLGRVPSKKVGTTLKVRVERKIGAQTLSLETGDLAKQAAGSCLVQYGETVVLVAAATGPPRPGGDFFPLTCDYRERVAAAGKFPGGFLKREGRPTTKEILTARLMDRPIRPQFPEWFLDEVQIQSFVLASDRQNDGDILAMNGASAALTISPLPFQGPLGSVRLAYMNGEFVVFPTQDELEESDLDLIVSGSRDAILMIEGFAREMPESLMTEAIVKAHEFIREICELQIELAQKANVVKAVYPAAEPNPFLEPLQSKYLEEIKTAKRTEGKQARAEAVSALKERAKAELVPADQVETLGEKFSTSWTNRASPRRGELILAGTHTGTIVMGGDVKLSPVSVFHGDLTVEVTTTFSVSQPLAILEVIDPSRARNRFARHQQTSPLVPVEGRSQRRGINQRPARHGRHRPRHRGHLADHQSRRWPAG